jgi:hypothetical protein
MIHGDACFAYFNKIWGIPAYIRVRLAYIKWMCGRFTYVLHGHRLRGSTGFRWTPERAH